MTEWIKKDPPQWGQQEYCITPNIPMQEIFANFARGRGRGIGVGTSSVQKLTRFKSRNSQKSGNFSVAKISCSTVLRIERAEFLYNTVWAKPEENSQNIHAKFQIAVYLCNGLIDFVASTFV